jgi:hypothetical protein
MLQMSCVPVFLGTCLASLVIAAGSVTAAPDRTANNLILANGTSSQCRSLFATVVSSKYMGPDFYRRKVDSLRSLTIADYQLRTFQTQFSQVFSRMEVAQNQHDAAASNRLDQQVSQLVTDLHQYCFK